MGAHRFLLCTRIFVSVGVIGKYSMSTWSAACNEQYAKEKEEKKKNRQFKCWDWWWVKSNASIPLIIAWWWRPFNTWIFFLLCVVSWWFTLFLDLHCGSTRWFFLVSSGVFIFFKCQWVQILVNKHKHTLQVQGLITFWSHKSLKP